MGWTGIHTYDKPNIKEFMRGEFTKDNWARIVEDGVHGSTYYAALERTDTPGVVFAVVALTGYSRRDREFRYKDMTEHMGPVESNAPLKVLNALTETDSEYALQWRERCRENKRKVRETNAKIKPGQTYVYVVDGEERSIDWNDGVSCSRFQTYHTPAGWRRKRPGIGFTRIIDGLPGAGVQMPMRLRKNLVELGEFERERDKAETASEEERQQHPHWGAFA